MQYPYATPADLARSPWWPSARELSLEVILKRLEAHDENAFRVLLTDVLDLYKVSSTDSNAKVVKLLKSKTLAEWCSAWRPLKGLTAFGRIDRLRNALIELDRALSHASPSQRAPLTPAFSAMPLGVLVDRMRTAGNTPPYTAYQFISIIGPKKTVGEAYDDLRCPSELASVIVKLDKQLEEAIVRGPQRREARLVQWQSLANEPGVHGLLALYAELSKTQVPPDDAHGRGSEWQRLTDRIDFRTTGTLTCLSDRCSQVEVLIDNDVPQARCERGTMPCRAKLGAVEHLLDSLVQDDNFGRRLREHMRKPAWQRQLERLRLAATPQTETLRIGWVLKLPNELMLCWIEPKKNGGLKATKLSRAEWSEQVPNTPEDALIFSLFQGSTYWDNSSIATALSTFVNRDGLYARLERDLVPIRVHLSTPRIEVVPTTGGSRVVVRLSDSAVEATIPPRGLNWSLTLDADAGVLHLAFWTIAARKAWYALTSTTTIPSDATPALTETLLELGPHVAIKKDASWLGRAFAPADDMAFRLGFEGPRGARQLVINARVRPVAELDGLVPGLGEAIVPVRRDGEVGHVTRDFAREHERVVDMARAVGIDARDGDVTWRIDDLDAAMAIWNALTRAAATEPTLQVAWTNKQPTVHRNRGVDKLALRLALKRDWLDVGGGMQIDGGELPIAELLDALRDKKRYVEVDDGRVLEISEALTKELAPLSALVRDSEGGIRTSVLAAPIISELGKLGASIDGPPEWLNAHQRLSEAATLDVPLPAEIDAKLRPYQHEGLTWAARLAHWAKGACLADEMGLGKTLQALALIAHRRKAGPVLVVAPTSVVPNWLREARRFAPQLEAQAIASGTALTALDNVMTKPGKKRRFALLVTSWDLVVRHEARFGAVAWGTLVLDEAHAMKNSATKRSQVIKALPADFVLALTGTPVENRPSELWSLFQAIAPGLLGSAESFRTNFGKPIAEGDNDAVRRLSRLVRPFVLRRTKANVALDLPDKSEVRVDVVLSQAEREYYEKIRRSALADLAKDLDQPLTGIEKGKQIFKVLVVLTRLRQLACHPRLVDPKAPPSSAKLDRLVELVSELRDEGRKVLIFSQFTELLGFVRAAFDAIGLTYAYLDGQTAAEHRMREVDLFQDGQRDAFLLSLKAGGVGLNLTAASEVIHLDPWWNPAVEDQATGRAHRIGQSKPVTVYRLVTQGTVEEQILALHADKRTLVAGLLDGTGSATTMTADELMALLSEEGFETDPSTPMLEPVPDPSPIATPAVAAAPGDLPLALVLRALQQSNSALKRSDILVTTKIEEAHWPELKAALERDANIELSGQARGRAYRWVGPINAGP